MSASVDEEQTGYGDALVSQLAIIDAQPLDSRAAAYAELHDQLQSRLQSQDRAANG